MMKLSRSFFFSLFTAAVVFAPAVLRAQREAQAGRQNVSEAHVSAEDLHRAVAPQVKDLTIDENRLRTHVMRPQHIIGVISDRGREEGKLEFVPTQGGLVKTARALVQSERAEYADHLCAVVVPEMIEDARGTPSRR